MSQQVLWLALGASLAINAAFAYSAIRRAIWRARNPRKKPSKGGWKPGGRPPYRRTPRKTTTPTSAKFTQRDDDESFNI